MRRIARIYTDFDENFGIPRQSGLADLLKGEIVFEKEFRSEHVVRGLEEFSHIWVIWHFDHSPERQSRLSAGLQPTVRPPRLGGNVKKAYLPHVLRSVRIPSAFPASDWNPSALTGTGGPSFPSAASI